MPLYGFLGIVLLPICIRYVCILHCLPGAAVINANSFNLRYLCKEKFINILSLGQAAPLRTVILYLLSVKTSYITHTSVSVGRHC